MAELFLLYPIEKHRGSLWRIAHVPGHIRPVGYGRLIRIRTHRRDADATIYVVAEAEVDKAIAILQRGFLSGASLLQMQKGNRQFQNIPTFQFVMGL